MSKKSPETMKRWREELRNLKFENGLLQIMISKNPNRFSLQVAGENESLMIVDKVITGKILLTLEQVLANSIKMYEETISFYANLNPQP
jgi:hypothetical protein